MAEDTIRPAYNIAGARPAECAFPTIIEDLRAMDCGHPDCKDPHHRAGRSWLTITVWQVHGHNVDREGNVVPTMAARQIEIPHPADRQAVLAMLDRAHAHRTGELTLAAAHEE